MNLVSFPFLSLQFLEALPHSRYDRLQVGVGALPEVDKGSVLGDRGGPIVPAVVQFTEALVHCCKGVEIDRHSAGYGYGEVGLEVGQRRVRLSGGIEGAGQVVIGARITRPWRAVFGGGRCPELSDRVGELSFGEPDVSFEIGIDATEDGALAPGYSALNRLSMSRARSARPADA